jgi:hypothetical protein
MRTLFFCVALLSFSFVHCVAVRYLSEIDSAVGFFISFAGTMHVTTDRFTSFSTKPTLGLKKYESINVRPVARTNHASQPHRYTMHPSEAQWLLATNQNHELLLSQDLGTTWKSIANRVYDFAWGRTAGEGWDKDSIIAAILEEGATAPLETQFTKSISLCVCHFELAVNIFCSPSSSSAFYNTLIPSPPPRRPPALHSFLSRDFFSNRELLLQFGNDIVIKGNYMFSSTVNPDEETETTLRVSVGASPFLPCRFPYRISEHE